MKTNIIIHSFFASLFFTTAGLHAQNTTPADTGPPSVTSPPAQEAGGLNAAIRELVREIDQLRNHETAGLQKSHHARLAMERDPEKAEARLAYHEAFLNFIERSVNGSVSAEGMARDVVADFQPVLVGIQAGRSQLGAMIDSIKQGGGDAAPAIASAVAPLVAKIETDAGLLDAWRAGREADDVDAQLAWERTFFEVRDILSRKSTSEARLQRYKADLENLDLQHRTVRLAMGRFENLAVTFKRRAEAGRELASDAESSLKQDALITMVNGLPRVDAGDLAGLTDLPALPSLPAGSSTPLVPAPIADAEVTSTILKAIQQRNTAITTTQP